MNRITSLLEIEHPLIQAPMAGGITTADFVGEVSNNGALGMIGAGYMNANDLQKDLKAVKQTTSFPFGVNVFVPGELEIDKHKIEAAKEILRPYYERFNLHMDDISLPTEKTLKENFEKQLECIVKESVPVCSFTFGVPSVETIKMLQEHDIIVIGTATTVKEAVLIEQIGMDVVVLQGSEAGGHRGAFLKDELESQLGLMSLIPQVADLVDIPIIAAGGIMDSRGVNAAFCLGADAVQMGTAFLLTEESGAHSLHKERIVQANGDDAILTRSFSGKYARGIRNDFIVQMNNHADKFPIHPLQNTLTQSLRKAAKSQGNSELMSLWSGQSAGLGKRQNVKELIHKVMKGIK